MRVRVLVVPREIRGSAASHTQHASDAGGRRTSPHARLHLSAVARRAASVEGLLQIAAIHRHAALSLMARDLLRPATVD